MSGQPFSIAGPVVGVVVLAAAGVVFTFFPDLVQRCVVTFEERRTATLTHRVVGVFLLAFAGIMLYARVPVYAVVTLGVAGAVYAFWPRTVQRLSGGHARSRVYAWELRLVGVASLAASAIILYLLMK